jgi:hypothetical protein
MTTFSRRSDRPTNSTKVFNRTAPWSLAQAREEGFSVSGLFDPSDTDGQGRLISFYRSDTAINVRVLWDGTNGFTQLVKVTNVTHSTNADGFQEISFEFTAEGDAVIQGTGPIL